MQRRSFVCSLVLAAVAVPGEVRAGNGPFFVVYDHTTHEPGEIEVMPMVDVAAEPDGELFVAYMIEVDIGLAERWQLDLMAEGHWAESDGFQPTGFRIESRFRLFDDILFNPVVYVEYEDLDVGTRYQMEVSGRHAPEGEGEEAEEGRPRERVLESRLILSDDLGPVRISGQWINETDLAGSGVTAFGYAIGVAVQIGAATGESGDDAGETAHHGAHHPGMHVEGASGEAQAPEGHEGHARTVVGVEWYGALGDTDDFGPDGDTREHYLSVNLMRHFGDGWMVKLAGSVGLTDVSRDLFRLGVGYEW